MAKTKSVARVASRLSTQDQKLRDRVKRGMTKGTSFRDSFVNFAQKLGIGADSPLTTAGYGFNPITRIRTMLEWIHRGSWIGGQAVDLIADDMTRAGVTLRGDSLTPDHIQEIEEEITTLKVWEGINETIKWSRLYGGAIGVMLIDGQDPKTPLILDRVGKNMFKGVLALDRWMVEPSLNRLITKPGPDMGLPTFYQVVADAPALAGQTIHHTRVLRLEGIRVPYYQRLMENLWGISVLERLYDRMVAFDSATTGAAQLVYKAYLRTYAVKDLRDVIAAGGEPLDAVVSYVDMMRRFQNIEGMTLIDAEDKMEAMQTASFSGISDALLQFGQQLSGALGIPLVRLFGQSPAGLNSTGESDLRMYYDNINKEQKRTLKVPVTNIVRAIAQSKGIKLPKGFAIEFNPLWQLTEKEKADIAETTGRTVGAAEEAGLISQQDALKELKASSSITGIFTNITDEDIEAAATDLPPAGMAAHELEQQAQGLPMERVGVDEAEPAGSEKKTKDSTYQSIATMARVHGLDVVIENPKGSIRRGKDWEVVMPYDYGYLRNTKAPDGEGVDVLLGPNCGLATCFLIDQVKPDTGAPDEPKVMFGFDNIQHALSSFLQGYTDGKAWQRIGKITAMTVDEFKANHLPQWRTS